MGKYGNPTSLDYSQGNFLYFLHILYFLDFPNFLPIPLIFIVVARQPRPLCHSQPGW
jgi:hypothetical protein